MTSLALQTKRLLHAENSTFFWRRGARKNKKIALTQNTPRHAILSEKNHFLGRELNLSQTPPSVARVPLPHPTPPLREAFGIRPFVPQNFKQIYTTEWQQNMRLLTLGNNFTYRWWSRRRRLEVDASLAEPFCSPRTPSTGRPSTDTSVRISLWNHAEVVTLGWLPHSTMTHAQWRLNLKRWLHAKYSYFKIISAFVDVRLK